MEAAPRVVGSLDVGEGPVKEYALDADQKWVLQGYTIASFVCCCYEMRHQLIT
jgi:hypothetical protein